jgi:hypothetical protein
VLRKIDGDTSAKSRDDTADGFEEDIAVLRASLVLADIQGDSFEMHQLVQFSTR